MKMALVAALFGAASFTALPAPAAETRTLDFGIVPQQSASRLAKMWGPFLDELGAQSGVTFRFRTAKDIPTFEACLAAGAYDVAYMNPMHYAIFSDESDYRAIARQAKKRLKGVIVARADSDIETLEDLDGAQLAFPSPGAFGASILTRATLSQNRVAFTPNYVKSHDSVYRAVAAGLVPAGGGVTRTFNALDPAVKETLRVIYSTEGFTPHAIAVQGDVDDDLSTVVQNAFLSIAQTHPELVERIGMAGLEHGEDTDWDDVRALPVKRGDTGILQAGDVACPSG